MEIHKTIVVKHTIFDLETLKHGARVHVTHYLSYSTNPDGSAYACDDIDSDGSIDSCYDDNIVVKLDCFGLRDRCCVRIDVDDTLGDSPWWVITLKGDETMVS